MKIVVISRVSDVRRREHVSYNLRNIPHKWQFFDAYEEGTIPDWFNVLYNESKTKRYRSYPLSSGEKGCFSSHIGVWIKCVSLSEPLVVLEDDFTLASDFYEKINLVGFSSFEYVKLEKRSEGYSIDDNFVINKKNRSGTVGYYLTPVGAFKLLSSLSDVYMPVDHYIGMSWKHRVPPVGLTCQAITHEERLGTNIQGERRVMERVGSKNRWLRFSRKCRRCIDNFKYSRYIKKLSF